MHGKISNKTSRPSGVRPCKRANSKSIVAMVLTVNQNPKLGTNRHKEQVFLKKFFFKKGTPNRAGARVVERATLLFIQWSHYSCFPARHYTEKKTRRMRYVFLLLIFVSIGITLTMIFMPLIPAYTRQTYFRLVNNALHTKNIISSRVWESSPIKLPLYNS